MAWHQFARTVRQLRSDLGYGSARNFYQAQGGRAFFGCTYRQYLNVESGVSAPSPRLVDKIALGLAAATDPDRARDFASAYLACLINSEKLFKMVLQALDTSAGRQAPEVPLRKSIVRHYEDRAVPLSKSQSECLFLTYENYWVFTVMANDREHWNVEGLAGQTGLKASDVKKALMALMRNKLIAKDKKGLYYCPHVGKVFMHPRDDLFAPRLERLHGHWERMAETKGGDVMMVQHLMTRASEHELRVYCPQLIQSVQAADICSTDRKGADTAFFVVETKVKKIMPF